MDYIACFTKFWGDEFERANVECQRAQSDCAKVEKALVKATRSNEMCWGQQRNLESLLWIKKTKLKEAESREEALKT